MAAPRKTKAKETTPLIAALRFVSVAQAEIGTPYQTHCRFINNTIIAYDGILAAGIPTDEDMQVCPHTMRFADALEKTRGAFSLTALEGSLSVKTDRFQAFVPSIPPGDMPYMLPDAAQWPLGDDFRRAATIAGLFTTEGATTVHGSAITTRNGSLVGTNGLVVIEAAHGIATPPGLNIPKRFVQALEKINKPLTSFGAQWDSRGEPQSFTVWFNDGSWLKTQLYQEQFPNVDLVLAFTETAIATDLPKDFYFALEAVASFSPEHRVYLGEDKISSHPTDKQGASHSVKGVVPCGSFNSKFLSALKPYIQKIDFVGNERVVSFFGNLVRGCLAKSVQ